MNIFGRSQESEAFETKTIAVTATPTLTRVIQNVYNSTALKTDISDGTFTTLDTAGIGSKTISNLLVGQNIIVNFSGMLSMPANPDNGNGSYQFQFTFVDGVGGLPYDMETSTSDRQYYEQISNEEFSCKWVIQKIAPTHLVFGCTITAPGKQDQYGLSQKVTGKVEPYLANRVAVNCTEGADLILNVLYKSINPDKPFSFTPSYFTIDVMRDVALAAGYT